MYLKIHTTAIKQFVFSEKSAKTEKTAINSQLGRPILRFWKSRGPGSISARLAYLAANLKIRKLGVVKITWTLSRIPKTSNFEKKIPKVTRRDGYPRDWCPKETKVHSTANATFWKISGERAKRAAGPRRRSYRKFTKRQKIQIFGGSKKQTCRIKKLQQQTSPRRPTSRNHCKIKIFQKNQRQFWKNKSVRGTLAPTIIIIKKQ